MPTSPYKSWDWDAAAKMHRTEWIAWLKLHHDKPVSEDEYVEAYKKMRETDSRPHNARRYQIGHTRQQYRTLQQKFGFFR